VADLLIDNQLEFGRLFAQHRKPLSHSWRGENRLGIVNPMAWVARTVAP
jgi:hypothetical protein